MHGRFGFGGNSHRALLQIKAMRESLTPDCEQCATKWASFQPLEDTALAPCHKYVTRRRIRTIDGGGRAVQSCVREVAAALSHPGPNAEPTLPQTQKEKCL